MGEMGLSPEVFWSLTMPEFGIKFEAFRRAEDRQRSLVVELALLTGNYKKPDRNRLERMKNMLRRYPIRETDGI